VPESVWSAPEACTTPLPAGREAWHLGVTAVNGGYVALLTDITAGTTGSGGGLVFMASTDGLTWETSGSTVIPKDSPSLHDALYRASLLPETLDGVAGYRVWYSAWLQGPQVWNIFRTWIGPPESTVTPPPVAEARIETGVGWCAVNDRTGRRIADLPDVKSGSNAGRLLMAYTRQKVTIPFASLPISVLEEATEPQQTSLVQIVNGLPVWSGRVLIQEGGSGEDMTLATASPEQYLLQRRVTTRSYTGIDRTDVAVALLS